MLSGYVAMTENAQTGGPTPSATRDDESTESETDMDAASVTRAITELREETGHLQAGAMTVLNRKAGIETEPELYEAMGFPGEKLTVELELFSAELCHLVDLFNSLTAETTPPDIHILRCRTYDELLAAVDAEVGLQWLRAEEGLAPEGGQDGGDA